MPRLLAFLLLTLAFLPPARADLQSDLAKLARAHRGKVAFYARHLTTGRSVELDADRPVKTASVIKLALFVEGFRQIDAGKHRLDETVALDDANRVLGSGVLGFLHTGLTLTVEDLLTLMMIVSDNTATNLLIDVFGVEAVNATMQRMGLGSTHLYKKIGVKATHTMPADQQQFGLGKTTAREIATLIAQIEACPLEDRQLCRRMLRILVNQQYRNMLPRFLETTDFTEATSAIGDKIGALDHVRNDVALVYTQTGPVVIAGFTWDNADARWSCENDAELLLARMARATIAAWSPKGLRPGGPPQLSAEIQPSP
jgi:beta-lactamase class A